MIVVLIVLAGAALAAPALVRMMGRDAFFVLAAAPLAGLGWTAAGWGRPQVIHLDWIPELSLNFDLRIDTLGRVLAVLILGVGAFILVYCARYFEDDEPRLGIFAAEMVAFAASMFGLVISDNVLLLYAFWEVTTILSFLLVGHYAERATSRRAATQALLVTTAGGLAMLIGLIWLGQLGHSYLLSDLVAHPPQGWQASVAIVLVLVGALSKSAIVPMHFWLPGAMAAPTPVSAYLHAAAMVKAGVFLVARLAPGFAESPPWRATVLTLGLVSMILAGWRSLREYDLKLMLAFGTVSQLGFMMVLVGVGSHDAALAGLAIVVAHALFKSTLFMVVGVIDHSTGTRDVRKLAGLGARARTLAVLATGAGASMAGVPVFFGFVGKEAAFEAALHSPVLGPVAPLVLAGLVIGSVFTVAYTLRILSGAFADKGLTAPSTAVANMHRPAWTLLTPVAVLSCAGLVAGILSPQIGQLVEPYAATLPFGDYHLGLWHGPNLTLWLTVIVLVTGWLLFALHRAVSRVRFDNPPLGNADRAYDWALRAADTLSLRMTATLQRGSLPLSQAIILATLVLLPSIVLLVDSGPAVSITVASDPIETAIGALMVIPALATLVLRNRLAAVLMIGFTGYGCGIIFALRGAPDLALTQFLVETLTLIVFILVLRKLPAETQPRLAMGWKFSRAALALLVGTTITTIGAVVLGSRSGPGIAPHLPAAAYSIGGGKNVVNVLLVDIRAWDTFGEISVLVVAATGVASLIFRHRRFGSAPRLADAPPVPAPRQPAASPRSTLWLRGTEVRDPSRRSLILETTTRLVFPTIMVLSVYLFFSGHNHPGGGFAGGLTAGLALTLRYLAGGRYEIGETLPIDAGKILGAGLLCAGLTAAVSVMLGAPVLSSAVLEATLPVFGHVKIVTAIFFDLGVYLIVVGLVLDVLRSLGARIDSEQEVRLR